MLQDHEEDKQDIRTDAADSDLDAAGFYEELDATDEVESPSFAQEQDDLADL